MSDGDEEAQASGLVDGGKALQEEPLVQAGQPLHRQKEARAARHPALAVGRDAAGNRDLKSLTWTVDSIKMNWTQFH